MSTSLSKKYNMGVKVGDKELITSGIIHLEQSEFEFSINSLTIRFCFIDDEGTGRYSGRAEGLNLIFELFNHNNPLGEGVFTPIEIGVIANKKLYATYYVSTVEKEEKKRRFEYAIYLGEDHE